MVASLNLLPACRVLNVKVPQNMTQGAKRNQALPTATIEPMSVESQAEPEFKHKWQADIAAAVEAETVRKDPKQR